MRKRGIFDQRLYGWFLLAAIYFAFLSPKGNAASAARTPTVDLVLAEGAPPLVKLGAKEIRQALERRGVKLVLSHAPSAKVHIYLGQRGESHLRGKDDGVKVPDKVESYSLAVLPGKTIVVEGSDAAGAFYGALDLAEQIGRAQGEEFVKQIKPATKSPYLQIRGVNTAWDFDIEEIASAISKVVRSFAGRKRFGVADLVESVSNAL